MSNTLFSVKFDGFVNYPPTLQEEDVAIRYQIKGHAVTRYNERVLKHRISIENMSQEDIAVIKGAIGEDLAQARPMTAVERMFIVSAVNSGQRSRTLNRGRRARGFGVRADTDVLIFENRVYFLRANTNVVLSMMRLSESILVSMQQLTDSSGLHDVSEVDESTRRPVSDVRIVRYPVFIIVARSVASMLQARGWFHKRSIVELRKILSAKYGQLDLRFVDYMPHEMDIGERTEGMRYVFHAEARRVFGVLRREPTESEVRCGIRTVDEVNYMAVLSQDHVHHILSRTPLAMYGCFDSIIECSFQLLTHFYEERGWSFTTTTEFVIRRFRDPMTRLLSCDEEPHPPYDVDGDVSCYEVSDGYIWFHERQAVAMIAKQDAVFPEPAFYEVTHTSSAA